MPKNLGATRRPLSPVIRRNTPKMAGPIPRTIPPPLTSNLTLDVVSELWYNDSVAATSYCSQTSFHGTKRCPVSWISGMPFKSVQWITEFFEPFIQKPYEWKVGDTSNRKDKFGWMPLPGISNATWILQFSTQDLLKGGTIRSITLFYMRSYGLKWQSAVEIEIERQTNGVWIPAIEAPKQLFGDHDKKTSEIYSETIELAPTTGEESVETAVRATITLVRGEQFKLMGLSVCQ